MSKKIKILQILHSVGGVDIWLRLTTESLNSDLFETVVLHGNSDTNELFYDNKNKPLKEYKISLQREISFSKDIKGIYQCIKIIKKEKPNLIHVHSAKAGVVGRVAGFFTNVKVLYTPHAYSFLSTQNNKKIFIYSLIEKMLSKGNSILIATSPSEKKRGVNKGGYSEKNAIVFNNCIKATNNVLPLSIPKTWSDNYICTVGRPSYQKNIELMLDVLHQVNQTINLHLVIMGVGHHSDRLEVVKNKIKKLGLQHKVTLLEWTKRSDVFNIIKNSKFYISTARYEGLPYSVIESFALAKPAIVTNCDGNRDLVENGINGYVIENENITDFSNKIIDLYLDDSKLKLFSNNALKSFNDNYNIISKIKNLEKIYTKYAN